MLIGACLSLQAQTAGSTKSIPVEQTRLDQLKGTYELKQTSREMGVLPSNLAQIIESRRKENTYDTVYLNSYWQLIIYPKAQITHNNINK